MDGLCGKCYPTVTIRERPAKLAAEKARVEEWEALEARAYEQMTDVEKVMLAQMKTMTELLATIAQGVKTTNKIATSPTIGFGIGSIGG
jgi:hypothetical protein